MPDDRNVISLHGIRTRAAWQKELNEHLQRAGIKHFEFDYGYFLALTMMLPWCRQKKIKWFRDQYTDCGFAAPPSIIAHSFGTYIVARSMELYEEITFDRIIFCGSIVVRDYGWSKIVDRNQCHGVLNDYGKRDFWSWIVPYCVSDAGPSGAEGFEDNASGKVIQRRHPEFHHSDYFYELNYKRNWIPFLNGDNPPELDPQDRRPVNWKFRGTVFLATIVFFFVLWLCFPTLQKAWKYVSSSNDGRVDITEPDPLAEHQLPSQEMLAENMPLETQVMRPTATAPDKVRFTCVNETGQNVSLFMYSCYDFYQGTGKWFHKRMKPGEDFVTSKFKKPKGWFVFFIKLERSNCFQPLGEFDLYQFSDPSHPTLRIRLGSLSGDPHFEFQNE